MSSEPHKSDYIWGLDLVRFAAALMVAVFHLSWRQPDAQISFSPGWVGVEIFFIISGFVIMGSAVGSSPVSFLERRFARLYPAAIACALINFVILRPFIQDATSHHLMVDASLSTLVDSLLLIKLPFLVSALWTIPIELGFYALMAFVLIRKWLDRSVLVAGGLIVWSALYLIPFALGEYGIGPHVPTLGYGPFNLSMLRHGCFFGVGMLIWQMLNHEPRWRHLGLLLLGIGLCWTEIAARAVEVTPFYLYPVNTAALCSGALLTFTLGLLAIWAFALFNDRLQPGAAVKGLLRQLGLMTYPLYLLHEGVGGTVYSLLREHGFAHASAALTGLALALLASFIVVAAVEPWMRRRLLGLIHPLLERLTARPAVSHVFGRFTARA